MTSYSESNLQEPIPIDDPISLFSDDAQSMKLSIANGNTTPFQFVSQLGDAKMKPSLPFDNSSATLIGELEDSKQDMLVDSAVDLEPPLPPIDPIPSQDALTDALKPIEPQPEIQEDKSPILFPDGLALLVECAVAEIEQRQPTRGIVMTPTCSETTSGQDSARHGISRYAPYGTRFAATMRDGTFKTSHVAGDLANRARLRGGRGARVDLILVNHPGETQQLESAWAFCESFVHRGLNRPGPSEVLNHLRDENFDFDYRKGGGVRLLQRNASNFYKRMIEYGRKLTTPVKLEHRPSLMDLDLSVFTEGILDSTETTFQASATFTPVSQEQPSVDDKDYELEEDDVDDDEDQSFTPFKKRSSFSSASTASARPIKTGLSNKGLSRHSPYGTRFCALMEDGGLKESFLAGDLNDRARVRGGRHRAELRLVLHQGEIDQLECAWNFIQTSPFVPGAAAVLDYLRRNGLDENHRKPGARLLQKNAGNFFKRVQEFGKRRAFDPNYLKTL